MKLIILLLVQNSCGSYVDVIGDMVRGIKFENCVYVIGEREVLEEVLISVKFRDVPVVVGDANDVAVGSAGGFRMNCLSKHVKVMFEGSVMRIRWFFEVGMRMNYFPAHAMVMVVKRRQTEVLGGVFREAVEKYGLKVVLVKVMGEDVPWRRLSGGRKKEEDVVVQLVNHDTELKYWIGEQYQKNMEVFKIFKDEDRINLSAKIRASVFNCTPFFYKIPKKGYSGVEHLLLANIAGEENLEYVFYEKPRTEDFWGTVETDVSEGVADVGMCSQWLTGAKMETRDVTKPYLEQCITFLVPRPYPVPYSMYLFMPLSSLVWNLSILVTVLMVLKLYFVAKLQEVFLRGFNSPYVDFGFCLTHVFRSLTQGSLNVLPPSNHDIFRFLLIFWSVYTLLLTTGYSAGYTSLMTSPQFTKPINSLSDFISAGIHWGKDSHYFLDQLITSGDPTLQQLASLFILEPTFDIKNQRLSQKNYANVHKVLGRNYLTETEEVYEHNRKLLKVMPECFLNYHVVLILRKNSPLKSRFDRKIAQVVEGGLFKYWLGQVGMQLKMTYMDTFFERNIKGEDSRQTALSLETTSGFFYFLMIGLVVSTVVFVGELVCYKICSKYEAQTK